MIFISGATGFLGREIFCRLLLSKPLDEFALLVRPGEENCSELRIKKIISGIFGDSGWRQFQDRIFIYSGDLSEENFGVSAHDYQNLCRKVSVIYHSAASISLSDSLQKARSINVACTERITKFIWDINKERDCAPELHYLSTAYVAGDTVSTVSPKQLNLNVNFKNGYEQSKAEAEALIRNLSDRIPCSIYRPSVVVGDSITGQTSAFNVIYVPAQYLVKGLFPLLPASPNTPFDTIPVDYVADAIVELSSQGANGECFHIASGYGKETTIFEIVECLICAFNKFLQNEKGSNKFILMPEMIALAQLSLNAAMIGVKNLEKLLGERIRKISRITPYLLYMNRNPRFDVSNTEAKLQNKLGKPPQFCTYGTRLFNYCFDTNWGRYPWTNPQGLASWAERIHFNASAQVLAV